LVGGQVGNEHEGPRAGGARSQCIVPPIVQR
jgi:hypothetical protein